MKRIIFTFFFIFSLGIFADEFDDLKYIDKLYKNNFYKECISESETFLKKYPNSKLYETVINVLAYSYYAINDFENSRINFEKLKNSIFRNDAYFYLANIAIKTKNFDIAEEYVKNIEDKNSLKVKAIYNLAETFYANKNYNKAENYFKIMLKETGEFYFESLFKLGLIYYEKGEYLKATAILEAYLQESKETDFSRLSLISYILAHSNEKIKDLDAALRYYKNIEDNYKKSDYYTITCYNLLKFYADKKDYKQALLYSEKLSKTKYYYDGLLIVGELAYELGDYSGAIEIYKKILSEGSDEKIMYKLLLTYIKIEKYEEALESLRKIMDSENYRNEYYYYSFYILYKLQRYEDIMLLLYNFEREQGTKNTYFNDIAIILAETSYITKNYEKSLYYYEIIYQMTETSNEAKKKAVYRLVLISDFLKNEIKRNFYFKEYITKYSLDKNYKKDIYLIMAKYYVENGKYLDAENIYKDFLKNDVDDTITRNLITVLLKQEKYSEMEFYLKKLPDNPENSYLLGIAYLNVHSYDKAYEIFKRMVLKNEKEYLEDAYYNLIDVSYSMTKYDDVLKFSKEYFDRGMKKYLLQVMMKQGVTLFKQKKYEDSIKVYENIKAFPETKDYAYFMLGEIYFNLKNYEKSEENYNYIVDNFPKSTYIQDSLYALISMTYENKKDAKCLEYIKKMLENFPTNEHIEEIFYFMANIYMRTGEFDLAVKEFSKVINITSKKELKEAVITKIVGSYYDRGENAIALEWVEKMADSSTKVLWKAILLQKLKRVDEAIKLYESILNDPENGDKANFYLGSYYFEDSKYEKARTYFNRIIDFRASEYKDDALLKIALSYENEQKYLEAIRPLLRLKLTYESSNLQDVATFKIGDYYLKLNEPDNALKSYLEVYNKYKSSDYFIPVLERLIAYYANLNDLQNARIYYNELLEKKPDRAKKYEILFK